LDDEFEVGVFLFCEECHGFGVIAEFWFVAGVGEFGGDVPLVDGGGHFWCGELGSVGFYFKAVGGVGGEEIFDECEPGRLLEKGFSAG